MTRRWNNPAPLAAFLGVLLGSSALAGPFNKGLGGALYYGPYTGGHGYSYNVAYSYGLPFSSADSWRKDDYNFRAGYVPYRPPYPLLGYFRATSTHIPVPVGSALEEVPPAILPLHPVPVNAATALVHVTVPAHAEVWFDGDKTEQTGPERMFQSPPLEGGKSYFYTVRARWQEDGRETEQVQVISVQAGGQAQLRFPAGRP